MAGSELILKRAKRTGCTNLAVLQWRGRREVLVLVAALRMPLAENVAKYKRRFVGNRDEKYPQKEYCSTVRAKIIARLVRVVLLRRVIKGLLVHLTEFLKCMRVLFRAFARTSYPLPIFLR